MELVVVERVYDEPLTEERVAEIKRRMGPCFELRNVSHRKMYLSKDRRRSVCLYDAPDAATVREAHEQENMPYARIWTALDPEPSEEG